MTVDFFYLSIRSGDDNLFLFRDFNIRNGNRDSRTRRISKAQFFDFIQNVRSLSIAKSAITVSNQFAQFFFVHQFAEFLAVRTVLFQFLGKGFIKDKATHGSCNQSMPWNTDPDFFMQCDEREMIGLKCFIATRVSMQRQSFTLALFIGG